MQQQDLYGGKGIEDAAGIFVSILNNKASNAQRDVVLANAAVAIQTLEPQKSLAECSNEALLAIESGAAKLAFETFLVHFK